MSDKAIIKNIPSTSRMDFGYRSINSSHSHNVNQEQISSDILDLYNKSNNIERIINENAKYIKLEHTSLEAERFTLIKNYQDAIQSINELMDQDSERVKLILPYKLQEDYSELSASINRVTNCVTARPKSKVSKLTIRDTVTDTTYIPSSLRITIDDDRNGVIAVQDNDLYAPFNQSEDFYWVRNVSTDINIDKVSCDYIIDMPEDIMTSPYVNEIVIHPFMAKVLNVEYRHGDSNYWTKVKGIENHKVISDDTFSNNSPFQLNFEDAEVNQIKITIESTNFTEGETNLRNFIFGLKHVGVYQNEYIQDDMSFLSTDIEFDEMDDVVIVDSVNAVLNNGDVESVMLADIHYEFYYKNPLGVYQYISENLPFHAPSKELRVKVKMAYEHKHMNISHFQLIYRVIPDSHKLLISFMDDIKADYRSNIDIFYAVRGSDGSVVDESTGNSIHIVRHELSFDNGLNWFDVYPSFNGLRFQYIHQAFGSLTRHDHCVIRVTGFDGAIGVSNVFVIDATVMDEKPILDSPNSVIMAQAGREFTIRYRGYDDYKIVSHHFSDDNGQNFSHITPIETPPLTGINRFSQFEHKLTYYVAGTFSCMLKVTDGVNDFVFSSPFEIIVVPVPVETIEFDEHHYVINVNENIRPTYHISPLDATDKTVLWSSSDNTVASVDGVGVITGHLPGRAIITIRTMDGGHTDTIIVDVKIPVSSVTVNPTMIDLYLEETHQLQWTVNPSSATNKNVTFSALNDCVSVSSTGLITAVRGGSSGVNVISEDSNHVATCLVICKIPVTGISLTKATATLSAGSQDQLGATVLPSNATDRSVMWSSADSSIATVNQLGYVTGVGRGITDIIATTFSKGLSAKCIYTVVASVYGVNMAKSQETIFVGESIMLGYNLLPANADNPNVRWNSNNPDVATVDANGNVIGMSIGNATITITTVDGGYSDRCTVTVESRVNDIIVNPKFMKLMSVNDHNWGKDVTLSLGNFIEQATYKETINLSPFDGNVIKTREHQSTPLVTDLNDTVIFTAYGGEKGEGDLTISLTNNRLMRQLPIRTGPPISNYAFEGSETENGIELVTLLGGFSREINYSVLPLDTIFTFSDSEGTISSTGNGQTNLVFYGDDLISNFSHGRVPEDCKSGWQEDFTFTGFYHRLFNFRVRWIPNTYSFKDLSIDLTVKKNQRTSFAIEVEIDPTIIHQGDINSYNFIDSLLLYNVNGNSVGLNLDSSLFTSRGATLNISILYPDAINQTNTVLLRGQFAKEDAVINLTVID